MEYTIEVYFKNETNHKSIFKIMEERDATFKLIVKQLNNKHQFIITDLRIWNKQEITLILSNNIITKQ